jgi:ABC-type molybdate transport system substrate-binding protein
VVHSSVKKRTSGGITAAPESNGKLGAIVVAVGVLLAAGCGGDLKDHLVVMADVSVKQPLSEVIMGFEQSSGVAVECSYSGVMSEEPEELRDSGAHVVITTSIAVPNSAGASTSISPSKGRVLWCNKLVACVRKGDKWWSGYGDSFGLVHDNPLGLMLAPGINYIGIPSEEQSAVRRLLRESLGEAGKLCEERLVEIGSAEECLARVGAGKLAASVVLGTSVHPGNNVDIAEEFVPFMYRDNVTGHVYQINRTTVEYRAHVLVDPSGRGRQFVDSLRGAVANAAFRRAGFDCGNGK